MLNLNLTPNLSFSNFEYLLLISIVFVPTFLLTFHPKSQLRKNLKVVILSILIDLPFTKLRPFIDYPSLF